MRYVEANPLRAEIVERAGDWRWSSLGMRKGAESPFELSDGPVSLPGRWEKLVNKVVNPEHLGALQNSMKRGAPFGDLEWQAVTVKKMGLESTIRPRGRPNKCTGHL